MASTSYLPLGPAVVLMYYIFYVSEIVVACPIHGAWTCRFTENKDTHSKYRSVLVSMSHEGKCTLHTLHGSEVAFNSHGRSAASTFASRSTKMRSTIPHISLESDQVRVPLFIDGFRIAMPGCGEHTYCNGSLVFERGTHQSRINSPASAIVWDVPTPWPVYSTSFYSPNEKSSSSLSSYSDLSVFTCREWVRAPLLEPYPAIHGGDYSGTPAPFSPDPLVAYQWPPSVNASLLQIYMGGATSVYSATPSSFSGLDTLVNRTDGSKVEVLHPGTLVLDFGFECAGWLEMHAPSLPADVYMTMSISEVR